MRYTFQPYEKMPLVRGHLNLGGANPQGGRIDVNNLYPVSYTHLPVKVYSRGAESSVLP